MHIKARMLRMVWMLDNASGHLKTLKIKPRDEN